MGREEPSLADRSDLDLEGLRAYLSEAGVRYAVLFGSRARGEQSATSDVDIGLRFPDECSTHERFRRRNRIDAAVQTYADGFVDVSDLESLPDEVALNAVRDGVLLCGDDSDRKADRRAFERRVRDNSDRRLRERREFVDRLVEGDV